MGRRPWSWAALLLVVVAALAAGAARRPTTGSGDDRLFALAAQLKCLQCSGETVANSEAPIAKEVRAELRRQLDQGRTDDEILSFFADRYGERILLNPSGRGLTGLVWVAPVLVAGAGLIGLGWAFRRWRSMGGAGAALTDEARATVQAALDERAR